MTNNTELDTLKARIIALEARLAALEAQNQHLSPQERPYVPFPWPSTIDVKFTATSPLTYSNSR